MGSKMSFIRGSSDQRTVSELTSAMTHPHSSFHASSDYKQMPEGKRCIEEGLNSRWGVEMKALDLSGNARASHSSWNTHSRSHAGSETGSGTNAPWHELVSSQVVREAKTHVTPAVLCSSATYNQRQPLDAHRIHGSPFKFKSQMIDKSDSYSSRMGAVQHMDISSTIPLPCVENYGYVGNPHTFSDGFVESVLPTMGRTTRAPEITASYNHFTKADADANVPTASGLHRNIHIPAQRLAHQVVHQPWTLNENIESDIKLVRKQTQPIRLDRGFESSVQSFKRTWPQASDLQVPAKMSRLVDSPEASSVLPSDPDCVQNTETDIHVIPNTDYQEVVEDGEHSQSRKVHLPQKVFHSHIEAAPEVITSGDSSPSSTQKDHTKVNESVSVNDNEEPKSKFSLDALQYRHLWNTEPSSPDISAFSEDTPEHFQSLPAVKTQDEDVELDLFKPVSEPSSPESSQQSANIAFESDGWGDGLLDNAYSQHKEYGYDMDHEADSNANIIQTKRGPKTLMTCQYCGRTFRFQSQFVIHQRIHTGERPFKCSLCGKGFSKNSNLNLHLKTHSKNNIYQKCPFCKIKFSCTEYESHMKMHKEELARQTESAKFERQIGNYGDMSQGLHTPVFPVKRPIKECQYCGKTFPFQSALIRHVRVHTGEKPYKCDICGKAFGQAYFLRVHELTHWTVKRYNCTRCKKSFTHYSNAKNHTCRIMGGDYVPDGNNHVKPTLTYTCHICKNVFDKLLEFNSHMKGHTGAKLYRCLYCDKLFAMLSEFNSHHNHCRERKNSSIKEEESMSLIEFSVPAARYSSGSSKTSVFPAANHRTQKQLSQPAHKQRNDYKKKPFQSTLIPPRGLSPLVSKMNKLDNRSDPRKYLCPRCGRQFRHMGRLRAHMLTHTRGQSYTCVSCGKTLQSWKKLWHHQRLHRQKRGRFNCPQCGRAFRFVEHYKKHMSEHPGFQWVQVRSKKGFLPYQCEQCKCSFKTLDELFSHQLCHVSTQDTPKDIAFDLSLDEHNSQKIKKTLVLVSNNQNVKEHAGSEDSSSLKNVTDYPDPEHQDSAPVFVPQQNPELDLSPTQLFPSSTTHPDEENDPQGGIENHIQQPVMPLREVKTSTTPQDGKSSPDSLDGIKCAICGDAYSAISELYQHYLQHARGQV